MLRRAELGVDFAFMALGAVAESGTLTTAGGCSPAIRRELRRQVFLRATIKDIRILDENGKTLCAAFPEAAGGSRYRAKLGTAIPSLNSSLRLLRLPADQASGLGVIWDLDNRTHLMAVVNTSALLFDILPPALRDSSRARIFLRNQSQPVAAFTPVAGAPPDGASKAFTAGSKRFPLTATIKVDQIALDRWNQHPNNLLLILAGALGLVFGILGVKVLFREPHPVAAIDKALAAREYQPYFQPIFDLTTQEIVACEVLARWVKADGIVVPPYQLIPLAEQTGRIVPMTWQLVDMALEQMRPFLRSNKNFRIGFNFGATHLMQPGFADDLHRHVSGSRVGTRSVAIEITERQELPDFTKAANLVKSLREQGYTVALDDAGTGHSGLSYVQKLGADVIKIDKLFVDAVVSEHSARVLVGLLVDLARELGMTTVAEGIERQEQADALAALGVDKGQGYLVSPPVPIDVFLPMLELDRMKFRRSAVRSAA